MKGDEGLSPRIGSEWVASWTVFMERLDGIERRRVGDWSCGGDQQSLTGLATSSTPGPCVRPANVELLVRLQLMRVSLIAFILPLVDATPAPLIERVRFPSISLTQHNCRWTHVKYEKIS